MLLAELFPEKNIQTDYDVVRLVKEYGEDAISEIQKRMEQNKECTKKI